MTSTDLIVATRLVNEIQGEIEDFKVRLVAVYPFNETGYMIRLRLMGKAQSDATLDSSYHRDVARTIRRMYPLTTVACERNALDSENEILVTVPTSQSAWKLTSNRLKRTRTDRLFGICHWMLSISLLLVLFPNIEEYVMRMWSNTHGLLTTTLSTT